MNKIPEVFKKPTPGPELTEEYENKFKQVDIIIKKYQTITEIDENGYTLIKRLPKLVNITKKVNEEKKLVKQYTAEEKLAELEKVFTK